MTGTRRPDQWWACSRCGAKQPFGVDCTCEQARRTLRAACYRRGHHGALVLIDATRRRSDGRLGRVGQPLGRYGRYAA